MNEDTFLEKTIMKIIMTAEEIVAAFNGSSKVCEAVLSYYGINSGDVTEVAIEGEENYDENYGREQEDGLYGPAPLTKLTRDCHAIINDLEKYNRTHETSFIAPHVPCIKTIRAAFPGASLVDCKARYNHWRANDYKGNV
jgi:hypothetical protein